MVRKTCSKILGLAVLAALVAFGAQAQQVVTEFADDFQSYGTQANPQGWVDSSVGTPRPEAGGLYKTWPDPTQDNHGPNVVYGTKQASGKPEGNNPRIGTFSTYTAKTFSSTGRFEYRGRFIRTDDNARIGFSFLSAYPQKDQYYLIGLWSQTGSADLSMQLFGFGGGAPSGTLNSLFTPAANKWYRFLIQVDDASGKTNIRARFWLDGTAEPQTWSIDASDSTSTRLTSGFLGIWSAVQGEVYVDDLQAKSPVDHDAPVIQILEENAPLPEGKQYNRFVTPVIVVTDDTPNPTVTITLDGHPFSSGTQITVQGNHTLTVFAKDAVGNESSLTRHFFIDSIPPVVTLLENNNPFPAGEPLFDRAPVITATTQDISLATTTLYLDGNVYNPGTPINVEKEHFISAKSVDALLNESNLPPRKFTVDLFGPVIAVTEGGQPLVTYYDRPSVTPVITVTDATDTTKNYLIKEGGASRSFTSGTALTNEAKYELAGSATDKVNRTTAFGPITFYLDRSNPVVKISANGAALVDGKTYGGKVTLSAEITDLTLDQVTVTVDGQNVTLPLDVTAQGNHEITIVATDKLQHKTTVTGKFYLDLAAPRIDITESGQPLAEGQRFNRPVTPVIVVTDDTPDPTVTITLDGNPFVSGSVVTGQGSHELRVHAKDAVENVSEVIRTFFIDSLPPVVTLIESGNPFPPGEPLFDRPPLIDALTEDISTYTTTLVLDGAAYTPNTPVNIEGDHVIGGDSVDALLNKAVITPRKFSVDLYAPVIAVTVDGQPLGTYYDRASLAPVITVTDATETTKSFTIKQDGASRTFNSGDALTAEAKYELAGSATDKVNRTTTYGPVAFYLDRTAPVVTIKANGNALTDGKIFNGSVGLTADVTDLTLDTVTMTVDSTTVTMPHEASVEGRHEVTVVATDKLGHKTTVTLKFLIDRTGPKVTLLNDTAPFPPNGSYLRVDPIPAVSCSDTLTDCTSKLVVDNVEVSNRTPITVEGPHSVVASAKDDANNITTLDPVTFILDKTPPVLTVTSHTDGQSLTTTSVVLEGGSDDAVTVTVNGTAATIDAAAKRYRSESISLTDGENVVSILGIDPAGNTGTTSIRLLVDLRNPDLQVLTPAPNACLKDANITVTGTVRDLNVNKVKVTIGAVSAEATLDAAKQNWTATLTGVSEGQQTISVEATDTYGHKTAAAITVIVDRSKPVIEILESGSPFTRHFVNRPVSFFVRARDLDPNVSVVTMLGNAVYVNGASIANEGVYRLTVTATDCAGNSDSAAVDFEVDLTPPAFTNLVPANGSTVATRPTAITGNVSADAVSVNIEGSAAITPNNGSFTLSGDFGEGLNTVALHAVDRAGNETRFPYTFTVRSTAPTVYIREGGTPLQNDTVFNRAVKLDVSADDATATVTATLNNNPYAGTEITEDGSYTVVGKAVSSLNLTGTLTRTFRIDRTGPTIKITSPATGTEVLTNTVAVSGTATDATAVYVNGIPATLNGSNFTAGNVPLELGENEIVASGYDAAGNSSRDTVTVRLVRVGPGILITEPLSGKLTNRPRIDVAGRVLSQPKNGTITVGTHTVTVDPSGSFRLSGYELVEGDNVITARAINEDGQSATASVTVIADFTPPQLTIRADNQPLADEQRFPDAVALSLTASDDRGEVTTRFWLDGFDRTVPLSLTANGGHVATALARDKAGNETRVERTFFIGTGGTATGCSIASVDPIQNSVITAEAVRITGRAPGAVSVTVGSKTADFANGSFTTEIPLPVEGLNSILVQCTDATGAKSDLTLKLLRVTGLPWIEIDTPDDNDVTDKLKINVTGRVGDDVVTADVNGKPATIAGTPGNRTFTVTDVALTHGINVLAAHARNAAHRLGTHSVRVRSIQKPPELTITAPVTNYQTGLAAIPVSGTYVDIDPSTLAIAGAGGSPSITHTKLSDTTGSYLITNAGLAIGDNNLTVTGRNLTGQTAAASVKVSRVPDLPSIVITSPPDNSWLRPDADGRFDVGGNYAEPTGSTGARVDVNAVAATTEPVGKTYTGTASFVAGTITPLVARYTNDAGAVAIAVSRVNKLADPLKVIEAFPAKDAQEVDAGAVVLIFFSAPVSETAVKANVTISTAAGPVSGKFFIDDTVVTWAPDRLLAFGTEHTIAVSAAMTDIVGNPIDAAFSSKFTTATTAPNTPPTLDPIVVASCGKPIEVKGTAPAGARLLLWLGELQVSGAAGSDGKFTIEVPVSGQSGYQTVRVRIVGADGTFSPAQEQSFLLDCAGPYVLLADYDRVTNKLSITFSKPVKASTITVAGNGSVVLTYGDATSTGTADVASAVVTVTPATDLRDKTFTLTVMESVEDLGGNKLSPRFDKTFVAPGDEPPPPQEGEGYISGEVYDATTGRPLPGARLRIAVPAAAFARTAQTLSGRFTITGTAATSRPREVAANEVPVTITTDQRGRYTRGLPEGAHTLEVTAVGYTTVWRQIVVPAGAGVIPIDIRLTKRPASVAPAAGETTLSDGGGDDNKLTRPVTLILPAGPLTPGSKVALTAVGAQSIAGLLPVGWSPLASAEVAVFDANGILVPNADLGNGKLAFTLPESEITTANQHLSLVRYDADRDEWLTITAVFVKGSDGKWSSIVTRSGAYAVVYGDQEAAGLKKPPTPETGAALLPAKDTCLTATTPCVITQKFFDVDPKYIPPTGRAVARLEVNGNTAAEFPSGTAVQAYVTETLTLSNGAVLVDPPFAADVLVYRNLAGSFGVAEWYLEPSKKAAGVVLSEGVDHVEVVEYPGRLDRGTLIGPEGGRVPGDDAISIDIPTGATNQPIHAGVVSLQAADLAGNVEGFKVLSGFDLAMAMSEKPILGDADGDGVTDPEPQVSLIRAARATITARTADLPSPNAQLILVESLDGSLAGRVRLAAILDPVDAGDTNARRYSTRTINVSELPVDGVIREGRYYVLAALSPVAWATGSVRLGATGPYAADADVASYALPANTRLGVTDLTRRNGVFALPVPAETQNGFAVVPSRDEIGTGQPRVVTTAPLRDKVVPLGDVILEAQRPVLQGWSLNAEQTDRTAIDTLKPLVITATFSTAIDPNFKTAVSLVNSSKETTALSVVTVADRNVSLSPVGQLDPSTQYTVVISDKLRGTNGAPFGELASYNFTTREIPVRNDFDPTKIHITIPVNGVAVISGSDGAVPGKFHLLGVRRDRDFITKPNTVADNNGAFTLTVGAATGDDRIEIGDLLDLYVIHPDSNAVWARVPLGPFVSPDHKSFVAPAGKTVTFRSADDIIVTVEANTFDVATIVTLAKDQPATLLNAVPAAAGELNIEAAARVTFEGTARKPLILSIPVPAGVQTAGRYFITSELVNSIRGPRLEAVTAAGVVDGKFQSGIESSTSQQQRSFAIKPQGGELVVHWDEVEKFLRGVRRPGLYGFMDVRVPVEEAFGWAAIDGIGAGQELFFGYLGSLVSTAIVAQDLGTRVIPVITGMPLTVVGVDSSSGLQAFKKVYEPLAPGDPGVSVVLPPPTDNVVGPFPIFGLPFRAEVYQVPSSETTDESIRNFTMTLDTSGQLTIAGKTGNEVDAKYQVEAFHTRTGQHVVRTGSNDMVLIDVKQGDRIVILIEQADVDPSAQIALTFNEALDVDTTNPVVAEIDLRTKLKIEVANEPSSEATSDAVFEDITKTTAFRINSGNRRVEIDPGAMRRGAIYKVTVLETMADQSTSPKLYTGSVVLPGGTITDPQPISLYFRVRKPHGLLTTFNLRSTINGQPGGALRELNQRGNILFVAALDGGLQAYDMSNPVKLGEAGQRPFGMVEGGVTDFWGVTTDHHNRIYTVGLTTAHGVIRSYRVEQFLPMPQPGQPPITLKGADQKGNAIVSMRPGYGSGLPQTSATLLSDRPEAIPRKITVLVQDDIEEFKNRAMFEGYVGGGSAVSGAPEWKRYSYTHNKSSVYARQRVTIENVSQGLRWSADAEDGSPAVLDGIIATAGDKLRLLVNQRTYGVVPLIGYGFSVFDLLAMESNEISADADMTERVVTTRGELTNSCDQATIPDQPCFIPNLASTPDVMLRSNSNGIGIKAFALDPRRGVLDVIVNPPATGGAGAFGSATRAPIGLPFVGDKLGGVPVYHPRLKKLAEKYQSYTSRWPLGRFSSLSYHTWSVTAAENAAGLRGSIPNQPARREYAVIAGHELGVLIVEIGGSPMPPTVTAPYLQGQALVDVIWTPAAALAVRVIPDTNYAIVLDQLGRVLLIDLSRIDERWDPAVVPPDPPAPTALTVPFPTALASLQTDNPDAELTGVADPRIVWISPKGYGFGTLPPVVDPDTGMIYTGEILGPKVSVIAALDPKILVKANIGDAFGVLKDVGGIVPLGVKPPSQPVLTGPDASLAAFRVEVGLPGSMGESLGGTNEIPFVIESERMPGATTEQTPPGFPRAHLRRKNSASINDPNPAPEFKLKRFLPDSMSAEMRHQKGYNKFVSPWVIGIADFRASRDYNWPGGPNTPLADKEKEGCYACDRPLHLKTAAEPDAFEIYTNGRLLNIHSDTTSASVFTSTPYEYLSKKGRLGASIVTVMADTMRTKEDLTAAQNPPVAGGTMMGTVYMHSGELLLTERDLSAGGRAGMDVTIDRVYRSRTTGTTPFGQNWDSPWFRRLRALPERGDVEYRDASGEIWLFKLNPATGKYDSPKGLFLRLGKSGNGWQLVDQKWRRTMFDQYGRLISEEDQFATLDGENGNYIRYIYDATGRLKQIVDPVYRTTTLQYWEDSDQGASGAYPGMIKEVKDWRDRRVEFEYDSNGRLIKVEVPERESGSIRPVYTYDYSAVPGGLNAKLDGLANLERIIDPPAPTFPTGQTFRVNYHYTTEDQVDFEEWGSGEKVTFTYSGTAPTSNDIFGQLRTYTLTTPMAEIDYTIDRQHTTKIVEDGVKVAAGVGVLLAPSKTGVPDSGQPRTTTFSHHPDGRLDFMTLEGVRKVTYGWEDVQPEAPGYVLKSITGTSLLSSSVPVPPVTRTFNYQTGGSNTRTFLASVEAAGKKVDMVEPHRGQCTGAECETVETNNQITATAKFDARTGEMKSLLGTGGSDASSAGGQMGADYWTASDPKHVRGLVKTVTEGSLQTNYKYPSATKAVITDERSIDTNIDFNEWGMTKKVARGGDVPVDETFQYNDRGQMIVSTRVQDGATITTTYKYDRVGRLTETETDHANTPTGKMKTSVSYVMTGGKLNKVVTTYPGDAVQTVNLDSLGRSIDSATDTGINGVLKASFAYDIDDNMIHVSDGIGATSYAFDAFSRQTKIRFFDNTAAEMTYDEWDRAKTIERFRSDSVMYGKESFDYENAGALKEVKTATGAGDRVTRMTWDGGGRPTGVSVNGRASGVRYDTAGRVVASMTGPGATPSGITNPFTRIDATGWDGTLPTVTQTQEPRASASYNTSTAYSALGDMKLHNFGSLSYEQDVDQDGNVTRMKPPGMRTATTWKHDSQGNVTREELPMGGLNRYSHSAAGALSTYFDSKNEKTEVTLADRIGRPMERKYEDGTTEQFAYEGTRLKQYTDRQGRVRIFEYNPANGQLDRVRLLGGETVESYGYDEAGRLVVLSSHQGGNLIASIEFSQFDLDGNPHKTKQIRYSGSALLDEYEQAHTGWNEHSERTEFSMPSYPGQPGGPWVANVKLGYDAAGNVDLIERSLRSGGGMSTLMTGVYRNAERPISRTITTGPIGGATPATIMRTYGYDSSNGLPKSMEVASNGLVVGGTDVQAFDGLLVRSARLLGVSGGDRINEWTYDQRGRVQTAKIAGQMSTTESVESLQPWDFRTASQRTQVTPLDPPSISFTEGVGHKIETYTRGSEPAVTFTYAGGNGVERVSDGRFQYEFDWKGRLVRVEEIPDAGAFSVRRVLYSYTALDRMVGRRAEFQNLPSPGATPSPTAWLLENRQPILAADSLPAEATFVWDPVSDQLAAVFKAGSSQNPAIDVHGGLVKQIVHGGLGYDDPIEVTTTDLDAPTGVDRLYPIFDEPATGNLQVLLNVGGDVVARTFASGAFGEEEYVFVGAAVDDISIGVKKTGSTLDEVTISVRATEALDASTAAAGTRLAVVNGTKVLRTAPVAPVVDDATVKWTLTAAQWAALIDPSPVNVGGVAYTPMHLSIAVTHELRALAWGEGVAVLPPPQWATASRPLYSEAYNSSPYPVELRETLSNLASIVSSASGSESTTPLYEVPSLAAIGSPRLFGSGLEGQPDPARQLGTSTFHAHPFQEPVTGLNYVRARWYDPETGTWLTPDPNGYVDSANPYAFAGGDPVNSRDPRGEEVVITAKGNWIIRNRKTGEQVMVPAKLAVYRPQAIQILLRTVGGLSNYHARTLMDEHNLEWSHEVQRELDHPTPDPLPSNGSKWGYVQGGLMSLANMLTAPGVMTQYGPNGDHTGLFYTPTTREQEIGLGTTTLVTAVVPTVIKANRALNPPLIKFRAPRMTVEGARINAGLIRAERGIRNKRGNVMYTDGEIDGMMVFERTISGTNEAPRYTPVPEERIFDIRKVRTRGGWQRTNAVDTEVKVLELLARELNPNSKGWITILSERGACGGCKFTLKQFSEMFPNVKIRYIEIGVQKKAK